MWYYDSVKISRDTFLLNFRKAHAAPRCVLFVCSKKGGGGVTPRQEKFCVEYLIDLNATQAAIRAGYSEKTAYSMGQRLLKNVEIKSRIKELQDKVFEDGMMSAAEALWRLSKAGRGELKEEVVVTEGIGDGFSEAKIIKKQISARDQIKALELMGKRHDLFSSDTKIEMVPVIITGEREIHE
jgi:phage terminase small subunit